MWAVGDDGRVQVLGIWLGGRTTADGHDYGRFAAELRRLRIRHHIRELIRSQWRPRDSRPPF